MLSLAFPHKMVSNSVENCPNCEPLKTTQQWLHTTHLSQRCQPKSRENRVQSDTGQLEPESMAEDTLQLYLATPSLSPNETKINNFLAKLCLLRQIGASSGEKCELQAQQLSMAFFWVLIFF